MSDETIPVTDIDLLHEGFRYTWSKAARRDGVPEEMVVAALEAMAQAENARSRENLRIAINAERDRRAALPLVAGLNDGSTFAVDADPESVQNLFGALLFMGIPGSPPQVTWRGSDNEDRALTAADVTAIVAQGAVRKDELHSKGRTLKDALTAMDDADLAILDIADDAHWIDGGGGAQ